MSSSGAGFRFAPVSIAFIHACTCTGEGFLAKAACCASLIVLTQRATRKVAAPLLLGAGRLA